MPHPAILTCSKWTLCWTLRVYFMGLCCSAHPVLLALMEPCVCCVTDRHIFFSPGSNMGGEVGSRRQRRSLRHVIHSSLNQRIRIHVRTQRQSQTLEYAARQNPHQPLPDATGVHLHKWLLHKTLISSARI